jgi:ribose 5-phosphate isomerase B
MKIGIAADHRGFKLKSSIINFLKKQGYEVADYGTDSEESVDYPHFALQVAMAVAEQKIRFGILLCYTGQGMAMSANKVRGVRAAICTTPEIAQLTRAHNDANVLVMPSGFIEFSPNVEKTIETFLTTEFEGGRHLRRLKIIEEYENKNHK